MITVSAVVLAAGLSSRMGGPHKLLLDIDGEPMLRRVVRAVLAVAAAEVVVVTGYRAEDIRAVLAGLAVRFAHNPDFAAGQPGSVVTGARALIAACDAVMTVLGDQPLLTAAALGRLIAAYAVAPEGRSILVPTCGGQRGNPVLFAARHIPAIQAGDLKLGERRLIESYPDRVALIEMADDAFIRDCDTPEDYAAMTGQDIYSRTILDRARHPRHQQRLEPFDAEARAINPLCGDRVTLRLRCAPTGRIAAIGYEARACAICAAAADLMAGLVQGMAAEAARGLGADFAAVLRGAGPAAAWTGPLEALSLFAPLRDAPSRIGCAILPWEALVEALGPAA